MNNAHTLATSRFGTIEFTDSDILTFPAGLVGFPEMRRFVVLHVREDSPFRWLQSVDEPAWAMVVTDPSNFVSNYAPVVRNQDTEPIGLREEMPRLVYTVVTIPSGDPQKMTLNLAGPILVNLENSQARQIVLDGTEYPIKFRVVPDEVGEAA